MRILITGSRTWTDIDTIEMVLSEVYDDSLPQVLVSGACPLGADKMCEDYWKFLGGEVERHPADWAQFGKRAGFIRNSEMVKLGADLCIAFIKDHSKGATMTGELAEKADIQTIIYRDW